MFSRYGSVILKLAAKGTAPSNPERRLAIICQAPGIGHADCLGHQIHTDLFIRPTLWLDWSRIRALAQLPFLQTSVVGFLILAVQLFMIDVFVDVLRWPTEICADVRRTLA